MGEPVRRAAALAGAGATIQLISVAIVQDGARRIAQLKQIDDLAAAAVTAAMQGVLARPRLVGGPTETDAVLDGCEGCALLVIAPGATAEDLLRRGDVPVLVAP